MAIERGVDDVDVDELGIEDNTKEIQLAEGSEEDLMFDGMEDEDAAFMDDGTMVFGEDDLSEDEEDELDELKEFDEFEEDFEEDDIDEDDSDVALIDDNEE